MNISETKPLLFLQDNDENNNNEQEEQQEQELQNFHRPSSSSSTIRHRNIGEKFNNNSNNKLIMESTTHKQSLTSSSSSSVESIESIGNSRSSLLMKKNIDNDSTVYGTLNTLTTTLQQQQQGFKQQQNLFIDTRYPRTNFTRKQFFIAIISMLLFITAVTITLIFGLPRLKAKRDEYFAARFYESSLPEVIHRKFSVLVSGNEYPSCADAGREILLNHNGSAMDAALSTLFCLTLSTPISIGFDSGFRGLIHTNEKTYTFDVMERNFPFQLKNSTKLSKISYPVLPLAAEILWKNFGRVSMPTILIPTIWLAENGIPISEKLSHEIHKNEKKISNELKLLKNYFIRQQSSSNSSENVRFLNDGEMYKNPKLAKILRSISINGTTQVLLSDNKNFFNELNESLMINETIDNVKLFEKNYKKFLTKNQLITINDETYRFQLFDDSKKFEIITGLNNFKNSDESIITLEFMIKLFEKYFYYNDNDIDCNNTDTTTTLKDKTVQLQYLMDILEFGTVTLAKLRSKQLNETFLFDSNNMYIDKIFKKIMENIEKKSNDRDLYKFFDIDKSILLNELIKNDDDEQHNVHITVYDNNNGDIVTLTTSKHRQLFDGKRKFISNLTGLIYDLYIDDDNDNNDFVRPTWPILIKNNKKQKIIIGGIGGRGYDQSLQSIVQVMNKLLFNCHQSSLKMAVDESRLFYQSTDKFFYESNFPRAYIDLLIRMFDRQNLLSTNYDNKFNNKIDNQQWCDSGVYVMIINDTQIHDTKIQSMIDYRLNGYVSGI